MNSEIKSRIHQIKLLAIDLLVSADVADIQRMYRTIDELTLLFGALNLERQATKALSDTMPTVEASEPYDEEALTRFLGEHSGAMPVATERHNEDTAK